MGDNEDYFPRGGKKPTAVRFQQSSNFLEGVTQEERKKKKPKKAENDDGYLSDEITPEVDHSYKNCGIWLNYKVVREGLLMLARIREVMETKLSVSLPCRMQGLVMACHISEDYNKQLEAYVNDKIEEVSELPKMFRPGQYVVVKVLEVLPNHLMLSLMPQHINTGRIHTELKKGTLLQAAVSSIEDHGYIMDIGVPNTKVFMPKDSANPEQELLVGGICWCVIKSVAPSPDSTVVTVSGQLQSVQRAVQRHPTPQGLLPGTQVEFTVDKPLDNGIEGHILDNVTAYIQRHHVDNVGKKPTLGQKIRARLLYAVPPNNIPFLTTHGAFDATHPDLAAEQKLPDGTIIEEAKVIKIMNRSVYLSLGGGLALLSLRRLRVHEDLSDEDVVAKSYPVGSKHRVRVLGYSLADRLYSVSDQRAVLDEPYFCLSQLSAGDVVPATVAEVHDNHLKVSIGRLKGVVPLVHMTESGVFVDPKKANATSKSKKKFKVGQALTARVLQIDQTRHNALLTLKPSLLDPELQPLTAYDQAEVGKQYTGVIAHIRDYLIVKFFNEVAAYVPRLFVSAVPVDSLADAFHIGQIVKCTILSVKPEEKKMSASLTTAPFDPTVNRKPKRKNENAEGKKSKKPKVQNDDDDSDEDSEEEDTSVNKKRKIENDGKEDKKSKKAKLQKVDKLDVDSPAVSKKKESKNKKKSKKESDDSEKEKINNTQEESDEIETDVQEEQELLEPGDLHLMDFSDCTTEKNIKKRVVSLMKAVKARKRRVGIVIKKIASIEEKGLNPKNKKYHTAMNLEKVVLQERIAKLKEALADGENKLKELNIEFNTTKSKSEKRSKKDSESKSDTEEENVVQKKKNKTKQKSVNKQQKEIDGEREESSEEEDHKTENIIVLDSLEPVLNVPSMKDFWSENTNTSSVNKDEETSSSEDEEVDKPKKKRKKLTPAEKVAKARAEEQRVREMEQRAIDNDAPRSVEQFQRALLAAPDSSQLWIALMAFHLQATEIEKARGAARKALATINFREEAERRNVWLALLNLEHRFGTKESQQKTLEEALQMNDTYSIHSKLLDILVDTGKSQELGALAELMIRKYRGSVDAYTAAGAACYRAGLLDKARQVMQKGIAALDKKEHVSLLMSFAKLERAAGAAERAEALCEQVLAVYPARVDVAAAYVDMLLKGRQMEQARQVLDRLTSLQLPARKMRTLYKKWIEIEERHGEEAQVQAVRQRAKDFLDKAQF